MDSNEKAAPPPEIPTDYGDGMNSGQAPPYNPAYGEQQAPPYDPAFGQPQAPPYDPAFGQSQAPPYNAAYGQPQAPPYDPAYGQPQYGFAPYNAHAYPYPKDQPYGIAEPGGEEQNISAISAPNDENVESAEFAKFDSKSVRLGFIKKVFGILAIQMLITFGIMCPFVFSDTVREYALNHSWLWIASMCLYLATAFALLCTENLRRKVPINLILLFGLTVAMSVMLGSMASSFHADEIIMAVGIVFGIVVVCAILGIQQKIDFTYLVGFLVVVTMGMFLFGLFCAIFRTNFASMAYACIGAILFSLWLIVDIQMIMGGKHKYQCDPEEYIFAAMNLYLDIVNILMYVLMIIGNSNK